MDIFDLFLGQTLDQAKALKIRAFAWSKKFSEI